MRPGMRKRIRVTPGLRPAGNPCWIARVRRILSLVLAALLFVAVTSVAAAALIAGTGGDDVLAGTTGDDSIYGRDGNDSLNGGAGTDDLDGGRGADDLRGGTGTDSASYGGRAAAVAVTLNEKADDGEPGEGDNVRRDVEAVYGGSGPDSLTGNSSGNTLDGQGGNDKLTGGKGLDFLFGGAGDDVIDSRDRAGTDVVDCGPGNDRVLAERGDETKSCEERGAAFSIRANGTVGNFWVVFSTFTQPTRLEVFDVTPSGASVGLKCAGGGCPVRSRTFKPKRGKVNLLRTFGKPRLRTGARIEIRITAPDALGKFVSYTMRSGKTPKVVRKCVEPVAPRPSGAPDDQGSP